MEKCDFGTTRRRADISPPAEACRLQAEINRHRHAVEDPDFEILSSFNILNEYRCSVAVAALGSRICAEADRSRACQPFVALNIGDGVPDRRAVGREIVVLKRQFRIAETKSSPRASPTMSPCRRPSRAGAAGAGAAGRATTWCCGCATTATTCSDSPGTGRFRPQTMPPKDSSARSRCSRRSPGVSEAGREPRRARSCGPWSRRPACRDGTSSTPCRRDPRSWSRG